MSERRVNTDRIAAELDHARRQLADGVPYCRFCPHCDDPMAPEEWDELAELRAWKVQMMRIIGPMLVQGMRFPGGEHVAGAELAALLGLPTQGGGT